MKFLSKNLKKSLILSIFLAVFLAQNSYALTSRNLTVYAEPNMVLALTKIARLYSKRSNVVISVNFISSYDLVNEIDRGEPADVFISAHHGLIEVMKQKGLIDVYNIGYIAQDRLVLTTSKKNPKLIPILEKKDLSLKQSIQVLNKTRDTLIVDSDNNSSGKYSTEFMTKNYLFGLRLFNKLSEDRTPVLTIVRSNPEFYALLLESQVKNKKDYEIIAQQKNADIYYQAMVIAGDNMENAREFIKFLKSREARDLFVENGFVIN